MSTSRRKFIVMTGAASLVPWLSVQATESEAAQAIKQIVGSSKIRTGRVELEIPPLVENGNSVVMKVSVESPMTENDFVRAIHVVAEGNPLPNVASFQLSHRAGRAVVTTRIRLNDSQRVWAIAQMSDGSFWQGYAATLVTLAACTEV
ncbi:MAG: SoxY-related AACIE arm protein [Sheuella sp.]|jgi:sulfur-oxidizing protein SoxY|nr:SoxY-related AACIE arm protein [Sheuella sp.]